MSNMLGPFLKQLRQARGITLSDLSEEISTSALSRFENGKIDLTRSRLDKFLDTVGIDYEDLAFNGLVTDNDNLIVEGINGATYQREVYTQLIENFEKLRVPNARNPYLTVMIHALTEWVHIHDNPKHQFSEDVMNELIRYLRPLTEFTRIERTILNNILPLIPVERTWGIMKPKCDYALANLETISTDQLRGILGLVAKYLERLVDEARFDLFDELYEIAIIFVSKFPEDMIIRYNFMTNKALRDLAANRTKENRHQLARLIAATKVFCPPDYFTSIKQYTIDEGTLTEEDFEF